VIVLYREWISTLFLDQIDPGQGRRKGSCAARLDTDFEKDYTLYVVKN
jgi:hypothetical protein